MADATDERQITQLIESIHRLTVTTEQLAGSLGEMLLKQQEDRVENKERQKKFDEEQDEFRKRQKKWDEQDWWLKNPWVQPRELAYFALTVALAVMATTLGILATR